MAHGLTQVKAQIRQIDRKIDGVRKDLLRRCGAFNTLSADHWQNAWNRFPELREMETALFAQRGQMQRERNVLEDEAYRAQLRREQNAARKAAKATATCSTCGQAIAA